MAAVPPVNNVFVYGSLQAEEVLKKLIGRVPVQAAAMVTDYHRYSIKGHIYPAVAPKKGDSVDGKVLFNLSRQEQLIFDDFEDVQYERVVVRPVLAKSEGLAADEVDAYMYVWAQHDDPQLYGDWNYAIWREANMHSFLQRYFR